MKKIAKLFAVCAAVLSFLSISCMGSVQNKVESQGIQLKFISANRTVLPTADVEDLRNITVEGTNEEGEYFDFGSYSSISNMSGFIPVKSGTWDITVTASKGITTFKAESKNIVVLDNTVTPVELAFQFDEYGELVEGYGSINLILSYPGNDVYHVCAYLLDKDFNDYGFGDFTPVNNKVQITFDDIPSGGYNLIAVFYGDEGEDVIINSYKEYVIVSSECESYGKYTIPSLTSLHSILYNLNGGEISSTYGVSFPSCYNSLFDIKLPPASFMKKDYYIFDGWYTTEDFQPETMIDGWVAGEYSADVNVYAKWSPAIFTVAYNCNGGVNSEGSVPADTPISIETESYEFPTITRQHYIFAGWYTTDDFQEGTEVTEISVEEPADYNLYAKWTEVEYPVIWNVLDSGMTVSSLEFTAPEQEFFTVTTPVDFTVPEAAYPGYILTGWTVEQYGEDASKHDYGMVYAGDSFYEDYINDGTETLRFTAQWDKTPVTVSFESQYGEAPESIKLHSLEVTQAVSDTKVPASLLTSLRDEDTGFTSMFWYKSGDTEKTPVTVTTTFDADTTLVAAWKNRYTVSYESDYGTVPESFVVEAGTVLTNAQVAGISDPDFGFNSICWYDSTDSLKAAVASGTAVNSDLTLAAKWADRYTVTYDVANENVSSPDEITVEAGTFISEAMLPIYGYTGYAIKGWYLESDATETLISPDTTEVNADVALKAKWVAGWKITYISDFGTAPAETYIAQGEPLSSMFLPTIEADGWVHKGWNYSDDTRAQIGDIVSGDIILTAFWYDMCTVVYETPYGTAPVSFDVSVNGKFTQEQLASITDPLTGFESQYWYFKNDVSRTPITTDTTVPRDVTIVAAWKNRYTISYTTAYETAPEEKLVEEGYVITKADIPFLPNTDPLATELFGGWYIGSTKVVKGTVINGNVQFVALWDENITYNVHYVTEFGTCPDDVIIVPKEYLEAGDLPTLSEDYKFFIGWYDDDDELADPGNYVLTSDMTFTAKWSRKGTKVTLEPGNSSTVSLSLNYAVPYIITLLTSDCEITSTANNGTYTTTIESGKKYETMKSSFSSGTWYESITVTNNSSETKTAVIIADFKPCNDTPYDITSTVASTNVEDFISAYTNSSNYYIRSYEFNVVKGTRYQVQWCDSYENDVITPNPGTSYGDMYLYVYNNNTGSMITSKDDHNFDFTASYTGTVMFVVGGRSNTCTSYFRPYISN